MDGVDLLDSLIGRNEIEICSKKWYIRLYYNFTDLTVVNSWLLYKRFRLEQILPVQFELAHWRKNIAYSLTKSGDFKNQRGRRSVSIETRRASTRALAMHPTRAVRTDCVEHS